MTAKTPFGLAMLALESQQVIWLRMLKIAAGGRGASAEFRRMGPEKLVAATRALMGAFSGDLPDHTIQRYRKKVRANRRRLSSR